MGRTMTCRCSAREGGRTARSGSLAGAAALALLMAFAAADRGLQAAPLAPSVIAPGKDTATALKPHSSPPAAVGVVGPGPSAARLSPDYVAEIRRRFTPENRAYARIRAVLGLVDPLYQVAIALAVLFTGLSARVRDLACRLFRARYGRALVAFALFNLVGALLDLPLAFYSGFALEHRFGLSNQGFADWLGEQGKDLLVNIAFLGGSGVVALAYLAVERSRERWWLWLGLGLIPVLLVTTLLAPVVIDPLYNKFTPLPNGELRDKIVALAVRAGIPGRKVFVADKSEQTKKYNAYVTGLGASQRIVLWDTTVRGMREDEILVVMAHEMGHYRLAHLWKGIGFLAALGFGLFLLSGVLMRRALARFGSRWGFHQLHDLASLPLFAAALSLVLLVAQPLTNAVSRAMEHEADVFALEITHANDAAARAFIQLASQNRSNPEPSAVVEILEYTHPSLIERVRLAMTYRPWEEGKPNRVFKPAS